MTKRILWTLLAVALAGCAGETGVRLVVRTDISVPAAMNSVTVTVYAGATGAELHDQSHDFGGLGPENFPLTVGVKPGSTYGDWVVFHVEGKLNTDVVVQRWAVGSFVDGEVTEVVVDLQASCLGTDCNAGQECRGGECADIEWPAAWEFECGNGVLEAGEECDDGTENSNSERNACREDCRNAHCGDGVRDTGEECDDGNTDEGDGCSAECASEEECGNGTVEGEEECDDENDVAGDGCEDDCTFSCHAPEDCHETPTDNTCTIDTCDEVTGGQMCSHEADEGATCNDGDECTEGEECDADGACTGGTPSCECDPAEDTCEADHGDDDPCNGTEYCDDTNHCVVEPGTELAAGAPCDDDLFCNGVDVCSSDPPATRACTHPGDPCDDTCQTCDETGDECDLDADYCFIGDTCYAEGADDPEDSCQECVSATSTSAWTDKSDGATCDDGDECTEGEECTGGACGGGTPSCECDPLDDTCEADLGDDDPCNGTLYCDGTNHCVVEAGTELAAGAPCDDGLFCTGVDVCSSDPPATRACTHPDPCETCQTCDEDADECDLDTGYCLIGGECYADLGDDPANSCQECVVGTSTSAWTPKAPGTACSDGLFCTAGDTCDATPACVAGASDPCVAACLTCNETDDTCDIPADSCVIDDACYTDGMANPENSCQVCDVSATTTAWTNLDEGTACDDDDPCTRADTCTAAHTCGGIVGCTTSPLVGTDRSVRLCLTETDCGTLIAGACTGATTVNAPASWTTTAWDETANPLTHCTAAGGYWVLDLAPFLAGEYCYQYRINAGATWYDDPKNTDSGAGLCGHPSASRFIIP